MTCKPRIPVWDSNQHRCLISAVPHKTAVWFFSKNTGVIRGLRREFPNYKAYTPVDEKQTQWWIFVMIFHMNIS